MYVWNHTTSAEDSQYEDFETHGGICDGLQGPAAATSTAAELFSAFTRTGYHFCCNFINTSYLHICLRRPNV